MPRMTYDTRVAPTVLWAALAGCLLGGGVFAAAADRPIAWIRSGGGSFERELADGARRGLRLAAVSDGLPCSVSVLQAPEPAGAPADYRVVADRELGASLEGLIAEGFVPVASTRTFGTRHEIAFERRGSRPTPGRWTLVEFEKLDGLEAAVAAVAAEGFRPRLLVRPAFRSWPGLSEKGLLLAEHTAGPRDVRVLMASRKNVDRLTADVSAATSDGWELDLLFTNTSDGGASGRRERATVVLSKPRSGGPASGPSVKVERRSSFGMVGGEVLGAAAYWDEYLIASRDRDRQQAWATPVRLGKNDADCGPLGLGFRFDAPRDQAWDVVALVAKPVPSGDYELIVVTHQRFGF